MDECIGRTIIALHEAEAFHRVEELDRALGLFTRELALRATPTHGAPATIATTIIAATITAKATTAVVAARLTRRAAIVDRHRFAIDLDFGCRDLAATIDEREAQRLTFSQASQPGLFDRGDMNENIFAAIIANDKAKAFLTVEKFDDARAFTDDLCWHRWRAWRAAPAETAAGKSAATTTTETITAAATAAEAITATAAGTVIAAPGIATIIIVTEAVALISAAPATFPAAPSIETHARCNFLEFFVRPTNIKSQRRTKDAWYFSAKP